MRMHACWMLMAAVGVALTACNRSSTPDTTGTTQPNPVVQHLDEAGRELKSAATEAGQEIKPGLERAKEEGREALHRAAEKVENWTATQPATSPGSQPGG